MVERSLTRAYLELSQNGRYGCIMTAGGRTAQVASKDKALRLLEHLRSQGRVNQLEVGEVVRQIGATNWPLDAADVPSGIQKEVDALNMAQAAQYLEAKIEFHQIERKRGKRVH